MATHQSRTKTLFLTLQNAVKTTRFHFDAHPYEIEDNEHATLTLTQFSLYNLITPINPVNSTFYWYKGAGQFQEFILPHASYATVAELATDLTSLLKEFFSATASVAVSASTKTLIFNTSATLANAGGNVNADGFFCSFHVKNGIVAGTGVTPAGMFCETHRLLGFTPSMTDVAVSGCLHTAGTTVHVSPIPPQLFTLNELYIRSGTHNNSMMSTYHDRHFETPGVDVISSNLLAKVIFDPLKDLAIVLNEHESTFSMPLSTTLSNIEILITDAQGRSLSNYLPTSISAYTQPVWPATLSIVWEAVARPTHLSGQATHAVPQAALHHRTI